MGAGLCWLGPGGQAAPARLGNMADGRHGDKQYAPEEHAEEWSRGVGAMAGIASKNRTAAAEQGSLLTRPCRLCRRRAVVSIGLQPLILRTFWLLPLDRNFAGS